MQKMKSSFKKIKVSTRGWLNHFGIANMKNNIDVINGWIDYRICMCIAINKAMSKERLIRSDIYDLATAYQSAQINY